MELLEEHPMREGLWDSRVLAGIIRWLSGFDEDGLRDEEFVPLERAWQIAGIKIDRPARRCVASIFLPNNGEVRETVIEW